MLWSVVVVRLLCVVTPAAPLSPGGNGFSNAGAKRVPETIDGPVLTHSVPATSEVNVMEKVPAQSKAIPGGSTGKKKRAHPPDSAAPVK